MPLPEYPLAEEFIACEGRTDKDYKIDWYITNEMTKEEAIAYLHYAKTEDWGTPNGVDHVYCANIWCADVDVWKIAEASREITTRQSPLPHPWGYPKTPPPPKRATKR